MRHRCRRSIWALAALVGLPAGHADGHATGIQIGRTPDGALGLSVSSNEIGLGPVDGVLRGCANSSPGFASADADHDGSLLELDPSAIIVVEILAIDGGLQLWTPELAQVLREVGDAWVLGSPPFDLHPAWHIDADHPAFDSASGFEVELRVTDAGTTAYADSPPLVIEFECVDPGACCVGLTCGHLIEDECSADGGTFHGELTLCIESDDGDSVDERCDNCPKDANEDQTDSDSDGHGDACDECPEDPAKTSPGASGCGQTEATSSVPRTMGCAATWGMLGITLGFLSFSRQIMRLTIRGERRS